MKTRTAAPWTFALVAQLAAAPLAAQTLVGVRGGANIANVSDAGETKSRVGLAAGAFLEVPVSPAVAVQLEGGYIQKGIGESGALAEALELNYVDFGVLLKAGMTAGAAGTSRLYVFAGPTLGISVTCRHSGLVLWGGRSSGDCDNKTVSFGAKGGVGVATQVGESVRLSLDMAYGSDLTNIFEGGNKNRGFLITAGAGFPLG